MVEKNMQSLFTAWMCSGKRFDGSVAFELKIEKGRSIRFDRVAPHQVAALRLAKGTGLYHKITDSPFIQSAGKMMRFTKPKPFDCFLLMGDAYVVILFYEPRQTKEVFFIDIDAWVSEQERSNRKSLTKERAREISHRIEEI